MSSSARVTAAVLLLPLWLAGSGCEEVVLTVLEVASIEVQPGDLSLVEGETRTLSAVLRDDAGRVLGGRTVTWRSDAPAVATVDAQGSVTAVSPGQTRIRGAVAGVEGSATLEVLPGPSLELGELALELSAVSGGSNPAPRQVAVTNGGGGELSGLSVTFEQEAGAPLQWLQAVLLGSTAPTTLVVFAQARDLPPGSYAGLVTVASAIARNGARTMTVSLLVAEPPPELRLEFSSIGLSGRSGDVAPASQTVEVTNSGPGTLTGLLASVEYSPGEPVDWLAAELDAAATPTTLVLRASSRTLLPGSYRASVTVASPDAIGQAPSVEVLFSVEPRN